MTKYGAIQITGKDSSAPTNLEKRVRLISRVCDLSKVRFLDCGCGKGSYVFALRDKYHADAWGVEYSEEKVAEAKTNERHAARITQGDLQQLAIADSSFDVALLNEVLEHVPNDLRALEEIRRVLKPGGRLIVFSPNRLFPFEIHGTHLRFKNIRLHVAVPLIPYVPAAVGSRFLKYSARNYWPYELRRIVRRAGFTIESLDYVWQTFENQSGQQPPLIRNLLPIFRRIATLCERLPLVRTFGVSQVIVAVKPCAPGEPGDDAQLPIEAAVTAQAVTG
jgi:ubiquinone/menaquinone biosynthesis C-methylase UbiE